ncbi:MAG: hypothetical protein M1837_004374 [Sclerophora amabilis]|nr:MAG: hypothetical protein M1837_004374 [Sclerophora amabilis]
MPSYFFHLSFELYPNFQKPNKPSTSAYQSFCLTPPGTNIFTSDLPHHETVTESPPFTPSTLHRGGTVPVFGNQRSISNGVDHRQRDSAAGDGVDQDAPDETRVEDSDQKRLSAVTVTSRRKISRDWRFDRVSIESIDMKPATASRKDRGTGDGLATTSIRSGMQPDSAGLVSKGQFIPSDPKNTELGWGIVHLYRDREETPGLCDDVGHSSRRGWEAGLRGRSEDHNIKEEDCTTLCILAVPSYLTPSDFLGFVGEKTRDQVSHFRMIRTGKVNRYMVLMKFRDSKKARAWRREWDGKAFNSMEPENCHVVFVKSIQFQTPEDSSDPDTFPDMTNDPFTPRPSLSTATGSPVGSASATTSTSLKSTASLSTKPVAPPTPSLIELPTCPVCLERMDETTGLLTILCQHVFHCACLQKWKGCGCPVCRYTQGDGIGGTHTAHDSCEDGSLEQLCTVCGSEANLWICLICGNVGCGRYDEAHAFSHYQETSHSFAMDIASQRVWDYVGDEYVHRLIQNKSDGKLVELPGSTSAHFRSINGGGTVMAMSSDGNGVVGSGGDDEWVPREKLDNIGLEYTHLLTSQLDSQRMYFDEKIAQAADKASQASQAADAATATAARATDALATLQRAHTTLKSETMPSIERDRARAERRADKASETARRLEKEWREEKAMNESLMARVDWLGKEMEKLTLSKAEALARNADLEDQNRDLAAFISGREKLGELALGDEVTEGEVSVGSAPASGTGGGGGDGGGSSSRKKKGKGKGKGGR